MNKIKPVWLIIAAVVLVVLIAVVVSSNTNNPAPNVGISPVAAPPPTPTPPPGKTPPIPAPSAAPSPTPKYPASTSITSVSPAAGAKWVVGTINTITWSKEAKMTGAIYLVNASDNSVVGWITQSTDVHQTYYAWNTRDLFLSRTSPFLKTVQPGQYAIKMVFDGGSPKTTVTSPVFTIIYPSEVKIDTYTLTIKNFTFSPTLIAVKQGSKLVFTNNDSITHKISLSSFSPLVIPAGQSYTFDTSVLTPGSYNFYSEQYSTLKATVMVQ